MDVRTRAEIAAAIEAKYEAAKQEEYSPVQVMVSAEESALAIGSTHYSGFYSSEGHIGGLYVGGESGVPVRIGAAYIGEADGTPRKIWVATR